MVERSSKSGQERKVDPATCKHHYVREPGFIPPATIVYTCDKCDDSYEKDVS